MTDAGGRRLGVRSIRAHNLGVVLDQLAAHPGVSRAQIATATGLTRATVSTLVEDLILVELVEEDAPVLGGRGRPASPLRLARRPAAVGVEINVDYLAVCVLALDGRVIAERHQPRDNRRSNLATVVRATTRMVSEVLTTGDVDRRLLPVAVALPGLVADGRLRAPNLPQFSGHNVAERIAMALPAASSVTAGNEANYAALAYLAIAPADERDLLFISGETGVGGGLILDGRLFTGPRGFAGEIGHILVDPRGPKCHCGSRGCLEQIAGQDAFLRALPPLRRDDPADRADPAAALARLAAAGDRRVRASLNSVARAIGIAAAAVVNVVDVPHVVLGGRYSRLSEWLLPTVAAELDSRVLSRGWTPTTVVASPLGLEAAALGAALSLVSDIVASPNLSLAVLQEADRQVNDAHRRSQ